MKNSNNGKWFLHFHISLLIFISGCINLEQTTKINDDGSGTIILHYWTKSSNLSMGDELGGLSFTEDKVKLNYSSPNTIVKSVNIENTDGDSNTHVKLNIDFKDFNLIPEAPGFSKIRTGWRKVNNIMEFSYVIKKDSVNVTGMNDNILEYKFEFPDEVISTNGIKDDNTVTWKKTVSDLKENIEMTATVKSNTKVCGIFGYEFLILLCGFFFIKNLKRTKQSQ